MRFTSIQQVLELTQANAKAAEVLGKAGAFSTLQENLNELESAVYAKSLVDYLRTLRGFYLRLEKREKTNQKRDASFREKIESRRVKTEERQEKHEAKLIEWETEVIRRKKLNIEKKELGKKELQIPKEPKLPKPLALVIQPKDLIPLEKPLPPPTPRITLSARERVKLQREVLNIYLSGHPLDDVPEESDIIKIKDFDQIKVLPKKRGRRRPSHVIHGVLLSHKVTNTRSKKLMARLRIEDKTGSIEVVAFPNLYKMLHGVLQDGEIYRIVGEIDKVTHQNPDGTEQTHTQFMGHKISPIRIESDKEWDIMYPLLIGNLRILPTKRQQSKGKAASIIIQHARKRG